MLKIMQNGIKTENSYTPCFYSMGSFRNYPTDTICIYARDYEHLPAEIGEIENDTDTQTDYFDTDKAYITPDNALYADVLAAYKKRQIADAKRYIKYFEKRIAKATSKEVIESYKTDIENQKRIIAMYS